MAYLKLVHGGSLNSPRSSLIPRPLPPQKKGPGINCLRTHINLDKSWTIMLYLWSNDVMFSYESVDASMSRIYKVKAAPVVMFFGRYIDA